MGQNYGAQGEPKMHRGSSGRAWHSEEGISKQTQCEFKKKKKTYNYSAREVNGEADADASTLWGWLKRERVKR